MPNKDIKVSQVAEVKTVPAMQSAAPIKAATGTAATKSTVVKTTKECPMSPGAAPAEHASELLGSLTTQQQQRTSARVIKKLRLEPPAPDPDKRPDIPECDTPSKIEENLKFPTVKQRMPKALWSADEKSLFFEALNEYGKDFDAITAHICAKMKKRGMPDVNLKTKTQVSHFYYRTWHKLSKHVHFGENVKKVVQELYALINYGELRKKLVSVSEKTCARLHEMVVGGSMVVRHRGRNVRARTPHCRALRRLNQITESCMGALAPGVVSLRARSSCAWARVQAAAHNPRAAAAPPPRLPLAALLRALERRWRGGQGAQGAQGAQGRCKPKLESAETEPEEVEPPRCKDEEDLEEHLHLETDRIIVQEQKLPKKPVLHVGPRPDAAVRLPVVRASEQLSSQKICFSSYLQRMYHHAEPGAKIRTPKRHRKDSSSEHKELEQKKPRLEEEPKLLDIDETAVDGIELMAHYKTHQEEEEKPSTEDEKELKAEETAEEEGENKYMSEREKDSFSEMEDDEKYNNDTGDESDHKDNEKETKFKNLKVKFRIRPKKRGGSIYTLVTDKDKESSDEPKAEEPSEEPSDIDVDRAVRQIRKGWSVYDAGDLTIGDLYLMFGSRSKLELDYWWAEPTPPLPKPAEDRTSPVADRKVERTPDKAAESCVEDEKERRERECDIFSPKAFGDSNDGMSGDERKSEQLAPSPERKPALGALPVAGKLRNRAAPASPAAPSDGFAHLSDRLRRLLALAGNPLAGAAPRCACGHVCAHARKQGVKQPFQPASSAASKPGAPPVFRHPTPIAPKPTQEEPAALSLAGVPRWRRGRPRAADRRVVVQRLLPLLPKLPPPSKLIPVKLEPGAAAPPRLLPKPPPTSTSDLSFFYVLSESNGQFFFHDGDRRIPISPLHHDQDEEDEVQDEDIKEDFKIDVSTTEVGVNVKHESEPSAEPSAEPSGEPGSEPPDKNNKTEAADMANFLPAESLSLSPSRLLAGDGWLTGAVHDLSLTSFLGQLEPTHLQVDSHLQSLMAESSVDYVAKFADLAAEVSDERGPLT